ncbi:MAG: ImmA/IrrE family metallo-endopeptidase [Phycisphaerales bacterium]|nr:MAG: ImmA/IrrE family metallo-endopeptidase [Phycisphaerales bacterium]
MLDFENIDPLELGRRLAAARKARGVTQQDAAAQLGCSRPTLIAIEKGERRAKPEEIVTLAAFYARSVHELVRPGLRAVELAPHLRAEISRGGTVANADVDAAIIELQRFAEDYRELERLLDAKSISVYPPEVTLPSRGSLSDFAEDVAMRERGRLGLGHHPVYDLRQVLEAEVGLRIFYRGLPSRIAGMFAYTADLGFCVLINRKHPPERRRATLAHEYGHALCDRHKPGIDYLDGRDRKSAVERFAEAFGLALLMPAAGVRRKFHDITASTGDFQVADLCRLSHYYWVSVQAMALRLEDLGLIPRGSWDLLAEKGFKPGRAAEDLGLPRRDALTDEPYPERYKYLAVQAYESGKISEGQLCRFLRCDPVQAREVVADCLNQSYVDADGQELSRAMPFDESLLSTRP